MEVLEKMLVELDYSYFQIVLLAIFVGMTVGLIVGIIAKTLEVLYEKSIGKYFAERRRLREERLEQERIKAEKERLRLESEAKAKDVLSRMSKRDSFNTANASENALKRFNDTKERMKNKVLEERKNMTDYEAKELIDKLWNENE